MRKIGYKKITADNFKLYGTFDSIVDPSGLPLGGGSRDDIITFYPDRVQQTLGNTNVSFNALIVKERPWVVDVTESHDYCGETILVTGGDALMHVAVPCAKGDVPYDSIEAFLIPEGSIVTVNPGVWHHAAFAYKCSQVNILCVLPERTYAIDCCVLEIPQESQIEIVDEEIK